MPRFYSELQNASLENLSTDPSAGNSGRIFRNTVDGKSKIDNGSAIQNLVMETGAQTLTNKTLTSPVLNTPTITAPVIDAITFDDQASTPSTPSAGFYKVYVKTDGRAYILNPSGLEAGLGGGGGGGALFWIESTSAPFSDIENNTKAFFYESARTQDLFCDFRVPSTYAAGVQIRLRLPFYSPDNSGTALLSTQSTLVRTGTDAITSTVNQRTSTNTAVTLTVANRLTSIDLDLTSASGEINVVAVAPGDLIRIRLFRGTDTATSDIRALVYGAEVLTS